MEKSIAKITLLVMIMVVTLLMAAQIARAGIIGSKHDVRAFVSTANTTGDVCVYCHTPHGAQTGQTLLWSRTATGASYTLYSSPSLNATMAQPAIGSVSKACLSCHDGTVAVDSYNGATGTKFITGSARVGGANGANVNDLSNDHPIGFTYDTALATADGGLVTPSSANWVIGSTTATPPIPNSIPLYSGKLECGSCHNVHDPANGKFLRVANTSSALCLKCHLK